MFGEVITTADTLLISGFSILIVFLVLLLISYMIDFCAWIIKRLESGCRKEEPQESGADSAAGSARQKPGLSEGKQLQNSRNAILAAAAIAAYLAADQDEIVVRRITRVEEKDSAWAQNARQEATR